MILRLIAHVITDTYIRVKDCAGAKMSMATIYKCQECPASQVSAAAGPSTPAIEMDVAIDLDLLMDLWMLAVFGRKIFKSQYTYFFSTKGLNDGLYFIIW